MFGSYQKSDYKEDLEGSKRSTEDKRKELQTKLEAVFNRLEWVTGFFQQYAVSCSVNRVG